MYTNHINRRQEVRGKKTYNDNFFVSFMHCYAAAVAMLFLAMPCFRSCRCHNKFCGATADWLGGTWRAQKHAPTIATDLRSTSAATTVAWRWIQRIGKRNDAGESENADDKHARWRIEKIWSHINSSSHRPSIRPSGNVLCRDEFSVFWAQFKLQKSNFIDFCSSDAVALISISLWSHNLLSRYLEVTCWIFAYKLATF